MVVELRGLYKIYPGSQTPAVADVNLRINEGEFFSILGSSGSGKTTTLRMIAGFEQPSKGEVLLQGHDVSCVPPYRRAVNTVFQNYALFPHMKVRENVSYPLKMARVGRAEIKARVAEALDKVNMSDYASRLPHQLSGGQKQRVALARALVGNPKLLLLDEPLGALDLKLREQMLSVLKNLQRDIGITFVYVTHDQSEALAMSDRVAVMHGGRVEQVGSPVEIYARPQTAFVASFIGKTNLLRCVRDPGGIARCGDMAIESATNPDASSFAISVRPEAVVWGEQAAGLPNRFEGTVHDVVYFGYTCEVTARIGDQAISFRAPDFQGRAGDPIVVGWPAEASVVVSGAPS